MHIPISDFEKYIYWKKEGYTRNCIVKTENFELILLCWNKGDSTTIHGHDNQKCWVYQVSGEMTELRYKKNSQEDLVECNRLILTTGKLCYIHDSMGYHLLKNDSNKNAITLHLYTKPVNKCDIYNPDKKMFEERILDFDTINGELTKV